ncbi:hypothetical protein Slin15195_G129640 [Septoria linicola]|uniref:Uncharacterized protein n=1 Tax=Septoria linicola TaxID=215465 RepID=A0A9Q9B2W5_9PEZI|nr:hypothetical protein Slin15195_G129640 [Septoria linicola]
MVTPPGDNPVIIAPELSASSLPPDKKDLFPDEGSPRKAGIQGSTMNLDEVITGPSDGVSEREEQEDYTDTANKPSVDGDRPHASRASTTSHSTEHSSQHIEEKVEMELPIKESGEEKRNNDCQERDSLVPDQEPPVLKTQLPTTWGEEAEHSSQHIEEKVDMEPPISQERNSLVPDQEPSVLETQLSTKMGEEDGIQLDKNLPPLRESSRTGIAIAANNRFWPLRESSRTKIAIAATSLVWLSLLGLTFYYRLQACINDITPDVGHQILELCSPPPAIMHFHREIQVAKQAIDPLNMAYTCVNQACEPFKTSYNQTLIDRKSRGSITEAFVELWTMHKSIVSASAPISGTQADAAAARTACDIGLATGLIWLQYAALSTET